MQQRMKTHPLTQQQINALLTASAVGTLATLDADGAPYALPVHFVWEDGSIYIHGLPRGQKLDNIARDGRVSFMTYRMDGLLMPDNDIPCDVNTRYESVVIRGAASLVEDEERKVAILRRIVAKYTPRLKDRPLPPAMVAGTAVIEVTPVSITGKYY